MGIDQILQQTPIMLYVSLLFLPVMIFGFFSAHGRRRKISASKANPADALKGAKINERREILSSLFSGAAIAFGAAIIILSGDLISDYKNSRGVFAPALPVATIPPAISAAFPPPPEVDAQGNIVGKNSVIAPQKKSGGFLGI